ncbi:MAG: class I SAM-dependent methyltransferase [Elusimicrobia bacterium]|nr:class I SAM-dependent methyltransferase [Elusimicrobiota bacterium]
MKPETDAVDPALYTEDYFLENVGGAEFFRRYGSRIVKPAQACALLRAGLRPGLRALDIGCGRGELLYQLRARCVEAVGVDIALPALRLARLTAEAPLVRADAKCLPFPAASFDRIFFLGVLDHLHDWELERCFAEFKRLLRPGGLVLANTCTNTEYYKNLSHGLRARAARLLGRRPPAPPRSAHDEHVHVNEHCRRGLAEFFARIGWRADVEARPNDKLLVRELYGEDLPADFPLRPASAWKRAWHGLAFRGPLRRFLAREFFCTLRPG